MFHGELTSACHRKNGAWMKSIRAGRRLQVASGAAGLSMSCGLKKSGMQSLRICVSQKLDGEES